MKWKRILGWSFAGIAALLIVAALGGYFYLRSTSFQQFAIREIVEKANLATGGKIQIGRLDLNLGTLTAHLYDITLRGTEATDQPPLLHADKLTVQLRIISALRRQVALREIVVDHPVVHVEVTADGKNNLPTPPPSQNPSSSTSIFDLAVEHARITSGEVNYNDRKTPLDADLYDLGTDIHFESFAKRYSGDLSYKNGHLQYAQYAPLAHNLDLKFSATPDHMDLSSAVLQIGSSDVTLHAQVSNYANPIAEGSYQIRIHTQDFASLSPSVKPAGDVALNGTLHYQAAGNQPALRDITVDGRIVSNALTAVASGKRIDAKSLQGKFRLADGNLEVSNLTVDSLGGRITAAARIQHLDTTPESSVQVTLNGISLRDIQRSAGSQQIPGASLSGTIGGKADAQWKGSIDHLQAHADLFVKALAASRSNPSASEVPVSGAIHASYSGANQTIELHDTALQMPATKVTAQGTIGNHSSLRVQMVANDLHQLVTLASSFSAAQTPPPAISGSATLNATVQGSIQKPAITAQLNAENLEVEGSAWKSAKVAMHANPSGATIDSALLVNAHQGQANLTAAVALKNWSYDASSAIKAHVDVQQLSIADLLTCGEAALSGQRRPVRKSRFARLSDPAIRIGLGSDCQRERLRRADPGTVRKIPHRQRHHHFHVARCRSGRSD